MREQYQTRAWFLAEVEEGQSKIMSILLVRPTPAIRSQNENLYQSNPLCAGSSFAEDFKFIFG